MYENVELKNNIQKFIEFGINEDKICGVSNIEKSY